MLQFNYNEAIKDDLALRLVELERINQGNISNIQKGIYLDEVLNLQNHDPLATALFLYKHLPDAHERKLPMFNIVKGAIEQSFGAKNAEDRCQDILSYFPENSGEYRIFSKHIDAWKIAKEALDLSEPII